MERIFKRLQRAGIERRDLYLAWDFTVASAKRCRGACAGSATTPSRGLGDTNLGDLQRERLGAQVQDHQDHRVHAAARSERGRLQRASRGRSRCPATSTSPAARPGRGSARADGQPVRTPGNVTDANFICNIPRSVSSATPRPAVALRPRAVRQRRRGQQHQPAPDRERAQGGAVRDATGSACPAATSAQHDHDPQDLSGFPELADRLQQGVPQLPLPRARDDPPEGVQLEPRLLGRRARRLIDTRQPATTPAAARAASRAAR